MEVRMLIRQGAAAGARLSDRHLKNLRADSFSLTRPLTVRSALLRPSRSQPARPPAQSTMRAALRAFASLQSMARQSALLAYWAAVPNPRKPAPRGAVPRRAVPCST